METLFNFTLNFWGGTPYWIIFFILIACGLGLPLPEDIVLFVLGLLAYRGITAPLQSVAVGMLGVLMGDLIIFAIGKKFGMHIFEIPYLKKIWHEERLERAKHYYHRYGSKVVFIARFLPGLRMPIYLLSGALHLRTRIFIFYDFLASILSVPLIIISVYYFGFMVEHIFQIARNIEKSILIGVILLVLFLVIRYIYINKQKKRELAQDENDKL